MKYLIFVIFLFSLTIPQFGAKPYNESQFREGDVIFQDTVSNRSQAIKLVTKSRYTHVGVIFKRNNRWMVLEAVQPVRFTPVQEFISRSSKGHFVVKRLKNGEEILTPRAIEKLKTAGGSMLGKSYDYYFEWSDSKMYCSELVWKIFKRELSLELGRLAKIRDLNLSDKRVKLIIKQRYGNKIPYDEPVITPEAIFSSDLLATVVSVN